MNDITESDLMSFIAAQLMSEPRRPDGFGITPPEFAAQTGCSKDKATTDLIKLVTSGALVRRMMIAKNSGGTGSRGFVYARPEDWARIGL